MKNLIFTAILSSSFLFSDAQVKIPQASPTQTIKQDFALGSIEVTYSRPAAKGRKIMDDLVPYDKIWRMGANAATRIKFNDAVEIQDKKIDSGTYVLYAIPNKKNWVIILNKGLDNWGTNGYKIDQDVARFTVPVENLKNKVESFTMEFADVLPESCNLEISWEKTSVKLPITSKIKDRIKASIETAMQSSDKKPYQQAATYYLDYEKDNETALRYITLAAEDNPTAYYLWLNKARIEKNLGKKAEAIASSEKSLRLATEQKNDDYIKMNKELLIELKK